MKKLVIKDIAEQLQVSKSTISFVLNGKARQHGISIKLENKILKYVEKVGYQPSRIAVGLSTGKSKTIGMLVEDISDPFFSSIARIVERSALSSGYRVIYGSTENDTVQAIDLLQAFRNHNVDGYIIAPPPGIENHIQELITDGFPVVVFDRDLPGLNCDKVLIDNFSGALQAVEHLVARQFKNIAMVTLLSRQNQMEERTNGYLKAIDDAGLVKKIKQIPYDQEKPKCVEVIRKFLAGQKATDAVFFSTNYLALSGIEAIRQLGLRVAEDIGIIVFDDNTNFELFSPSISAVAQPVKQIGEQVTQIMLNRLQSNTQAGFERVVLKTTLIARESTVNQVPALVK